MDNNVAVILGCLYVKEYYGDSEPFERVISDRSGVSVPVNQELYGSYQKLLLSGIVERDNELSWFYPVDGVLK